MVIQRLLISTCIIVLLTGCHNSANNVGEEPSQAEKTVTQDPQVTVPLSESPIGVGPLAPEPPLRPDFFERGHAERKGNHDDNICDDCIFAQSGFGSGPDGWYEIDTPTYPQTVLLSQNGNIEFFKGNIAVTDTGITIQESGTYWVSINVILLNENEEYSPLIPLFLIQNDTFVPSDVSKYLGTTVSLMSDVVTSVNTDGILANLSRGTTLSIVATNGGSPQPEPVTVISWSISVNRICD